MRFNFMENNPVGKHELSKWCRKVHPNVYTHDIFRELICLQIFAALLFYIFDHDDEVDILF